MIMKSTDVPDCLSSAMSAVSLRSSSPEPVPTNIKKEEVKGPAGERKMMEVICLQTFYGSFKLDDTLPEILGSSKHDIIEGKIDIHFSAFSVQTSMIDMSSFILFFNSRNESPLPGNDPWQVQGEANGFVDDFACCIFSHLRSATVPWVVGSCRREGRHLAQPSVFQSIRRDEVEERSWHVHHVPA